MKKINILLIILCIHSHILNAQYKCGDRRLPSSAQLLETLSHKPVKLNPRKFLLNCNVTDSVKKRLIYLLNWEWTPEELKEYLKNDLTEHESFYNIKKRAGLVAKGSDSIYKIAYDSISNIIMKEDVSNLKASNSFSVDASIILTIAYLNITEAIPQLTMALKDQNHYNQSAVELALARFGNRYLQQKIIEQCLPINKLDGFEWLDDFTAKARRLILIDTQESFYSFNMWLDTTKTVETFPGKPFDKSSYRVLAYLRDFILNKDFQELIKPVPLDANCPCNNDLVLLVRKWLIDNKGRYEINKNLYPW